MVSRSRMPPPSWTCSLSPTAATMSRITFSFFGRPATAPFRSTTCRRLAPSAAQCLAIATGSSEKTVAVAMSPCFRRTHLPSFRSIAGMMSTECSGNASGTPVQEVGEKLQARGLAFFRMELDGENIIPCDCAGKGCPVDASGGRKRAIGGRGVVAVHEIEAAADGKARPHRGPPRLDDLVPSHVVDLQPGRRQAGYAARQDAEPGRVPLLAALEQHLQPDAKAEPGLFPRRINDRLARAALRKLAHAVGHGALPRD